jgi:urease accessory protein
MPATRPTISAGAVAMSMGIEASLYRLMTWLSPAFPIGGYSYSHGLEYAVEVALVTNAQTLAMWAETILTVAAGRSDAAILAAAYRMARTGNEAGLDGIAELASAWRGTSEAALESEAQGTAFLTATRAAWPCAELVAFAGRHRQAMLPVAVGVACAFHGVPLDLALPAYLHAFAANLVSAGVRLIPLGQSDGQRIIARLESCVGAAAKAGLESRIDNVGTGAPLVEWCSAKHETQYTRLFRS